MAEVNRSINMFSVLLCPVAVQFHWFCSGLDSSRFAWQAVKMKNGVVRQ